MSEGVVLRRAPRRPRAAVTVPLLSLAVLVLGWSVLWAVARDQAGTALDAVLASEAAHGRRWTCPDRTIDGYPFVVAVTCRGVGFEGVVDGSPGRGSLAGLTARAWLYEPSAAYVILDGPLNLSTADGRGDFTLGWDRFGAKLRGILGRRARAELVGEGFRLTRPDGTGGTARRVELRAAPAVDPAADDAGTVDIAVKGLAVPLFDAVTGEAAPLDGAVSGVVTHAMGNLPDLGPATVERWRAAGGRLDVSSAALAKGPLTFGATGTLGLDPQHRVQGRLDATFGGFGPLMKRYGISLGAVEVGGMIANLLGTKPAPKPTPGTLSLPVTFADGTVAVGPFKTPLRLFPLY